MRSTIGPYGDISIQCGTPVQRMSCVVNQCPLFVSKINWLPSQQRPLGDRKTNVTLIILTMSFNCENFDKIGAVLSGEICQFLPNVSRVTISYVVIVGLLIEASVRVAGNCDSLIHFGMLVCPINIEYTTWLKNLL